MASFIYLKEVVPYGELDGTGPGTAGVVGQMAGGFAGFYGVRTFRVTAGEERWRWGLRGDALLKEGELSAWVG